jgi:hypothetical protein
MTEIKKTSPNYDIFFTLPFFLFRNLIHIKSLTDFPEKYNSMYFKVNYHISQFLMLA